MEAINVENYKPAPKWVIMYYDENCKVKMIMVYSDEERDEFIAAMPEKGWELIAVYERT